MMQTDGVAAHVTVGALKCELASEILRSFGTLRFAAAGWSMLPALWPGDVLVINLVSSDQIQIGDIVLVGREGRLFAHRVVAETQDSSSPRWITQGDALPAPDFPVNQTELLGRVTSIVRAGETFPVPARGSLIGCWIAKTIRQSSISGRAVVHLHRRLHTRKGSILP